LPFQVSNLKIGVIFGLVNLVVNKLMGYDENRNKRAFKKETIIFQKLS